VNAPFDWFSLGLTRAFLRCGLELGGWWPYVLAVADAVVAVALISALAAGTVFGVQVFDLTAVAYGGKAVLPFNQLFDGLSEHPGAPEYWWVYALLITTMLPSLCNLTVAGISLLRGIPWVNFWLLRNLPADTAVPAFDRQMIALAMTGQVLLGAMLGIAAQGFLVVVVFGLALPAVGHSLLEFAKDIAAFNAPQRVWALFIAR